MKILLAEDNKVTSKIFDKLLTKEGHKVILAENGKKAWELFKEKPFKLVITDWVMPEMSGIDLCKKIRNADTDHYVYIIMQTGKDNLTDTIESFEAGADDYIVKPFDPAEMRVRVRTGVRIINLELHLTKQKNMIITKHRELKKGYRENILLLSSLSEMLNPVIGGYLKQVGYLSKKLASDFKLDKTEINQIEIAGLFHDVGLLGLPESITLKDNNQMNEAEQALFRQHPVITSCLFNDMEYFMKSGEFIEKHHENVDGSGFPGGLKKAEIPFGARIIAAVSDYCKIIHSWPTDSEIIKKRAIKNFGDKIKEVFDDDATEPLIVRVAKKSLELGCNQKYDDVVVKKLLKRIDLENQDNASIKWLPIEDLKGGMVLEETLTLKSGEHLLSREIMLNKESIELIKKLKEVGGLAEKIYVKF